MSRIAARLSRLASRALSSIGSQLRSRRYRRDLAQGAAAGQLTWVFDPRPPPPPLVEVRLPAASVDREAAASWRALQTLAELRVVGVAADGRECWRHEADSERCDEEAAWFAAPGGLPDLLPADLESALLVAAAEAVDAVVLLERHAVTPAPDVTAADAATDPELRRHALFAAGSWSWDPAADRVTPERRNLLVKIVEPAGTGADDRTPARYNERRRGPYLSGDRLGPVLEVGVRDAAALGRRPRRSDRPPVLVTVPFLARGGAEHTLHATMAELGDRFDFAIATLAPHRPELGDRRSDFRALTERLYCLGDLVHPAAMYGMLVALVDGLGAEILYNANSTTLFYEFAPRLKRDRPGVRIVDHLYDHEVGYIDRYGPELLGSIDACVAENHRIAEVLVEQRGWPADRVPVIWPCGRPASDFPPEREREAVRRRLRHELGFADDDVVLLTAARMHPQKRPLDLVALAERVRDLQRVQLLVVGGGELEQAVDRAIAGSGARIRRLPFRTDIPDLIVACDAGCLVSDFEGLPVFMLECLQAGRPFLGTDVGDMGEVLRATGAGIVVARPGDLAALEAAVRRLADGAERARLAARAASAAARFEPAVCADAYAAALRGDAA